MDASIKFQNGENGPYSVDQAIGLFVAIQKHIDESNLTDQGKKVRSGQLCSKLTKIISTTSWAGLKKVNRKFGGIDIWVNIDGEVIGVDAMISDSNGDCYDLEEALGKVDFMIPVEEIYRRALEARDLDLS